MLPGFHQPSTNINKLWKNVMVKLKKKHREHGLLGQGVLTKVNGLGHLLALLLQSKIDWFFFRI